MSPCSKVSKLKVGLGIPELEADVRSEDGLRDIGEI